MKDAHLLSSSLFFRDVILATAMWPFSFLSGLFRQKRFKRLGIRCFNLTLTHHGRIALRSQLGFA